MLPSLFISHGSPMLAMRPSPARDFLAGLGSQLPRPKAIVVASGHWETERPVVSGVATNDTIHDFYGFPPALYAIRYPAPGSPELAKRIAALLRQSGLTVEVDHGRGLDHGAWVPLSLMYPGHDIPVLQLALQSRLGPPHHLQLGRAIAALREQDVLVIGSGSFTHNLARPRAPDLDAPPPPDIVAFADWMHASLTGRRVDDLLDYRRKAPYAALQHPSEEHCYRCSSPWVLRVKPRTRRGCTPARHGAHCAWTPIASTPDAVVPVRNAARCRNVGIARRAAPSDVPRHKRHYPAGAAWRCPAAAIRRSAVIGRTACAAWLIDVRRPSWRALPHMKGPLSPRRGLSLQRRTAQFRLHLDRTGRHTPTMEEAKGS